MPASIDFAGILGQAMPAMIVGVILLIRQAKDRRRIVALKEMVDLQSAMLDNHETAIQGLEDRRDGLAELATPGPKGVTRMPCKFVVRGRAKPAAVSAEDLED